VSGTARARRAASQVPGQSAAERSDRGFRLVVRLTLPGSACRVVGSPRQRGGRQERAAVTDRRRAAALVSGTPFDCDGKTSTWADGAASIRRTNVGSLTAIPTKPPELRTAHSPADAMPALPRTASPSATPGTRSSRRKLTGQRLRLHSAQWCPNRRGHPHSALHHPAPPHPAPRPPTLDRGPTPGTAGGTRRDQGTSRALSP
jgi:hypothetical protein